MPQSLPFFVVGCSRSGSTLLQALLDAHPNIAIPPESQIYHRVGQYSGLYGDLENERNRRRFVCDLLEDAYVRAWGLDASSYEDVEALMPRATRAGVIGALFRLYTEQHGATHWGDKTPEHVHHLHLIRKDFPDAKLIHLIRDGRDTAEAYRRMIYGPVSPVGLARAWRDQVLPWRMYQEEVGSENMLEIRYEDLVTAPQDTLKGLLDFIEEPYVDTSDTYEESELTQSSVTRPWHHSLKGGISTDKVGIYRKRFSERDIEVFEAVAGDALRAYGYPLDNEDPTSPTTRDRVISRLGDPLVRWWRKSFHPQAFAWDLQLKGRVVRRRVLGGLQSRFDEFGLAVGLSRSTTQGGSHGRRGTLRDSVR